MSDKIKMSDVMRWAGYEGLPGGRELITKAEGICLNCGKDIFDDIVGAAEFAADSREDR